MVFYKIDCEINQVLIGTREEISKLFEKKTAAFNAIHPDTCFFPVDYYKYDITLGAVFKDEWDSDLLTSYTDSLGLQLDDYSISEITISKLFSLLDSDFYSKDEEFTDHFSISGLRYSGNSSFDEDILNMMSKRNITFIAKNILNSPSLCDEIKRIFACSTNNIINHPVHYCLRSNDNNWIYNTLSVLLNSLYLKNRIKNKRYCIIDVGEECPRGNRLDNIFNINKGGVIIFNYESGDGEDSSEAASSHALEMIYKLCRKHHRDVLTIFTLKSNPRMIESLRSNLSLDLVTIEEQYLYRDQARDFLKKRAMEKKIKNYQTLLEKIEPDHAYLSMELGKIFDDFYDDYIKKVYYSPYVNRPIKTAVVSNAPSKTAYEELEAMIGLSEPKKIIKQVLDYNRMAKIYEDNGVQTAHPSMHMIFTGNPGTAKTTVARLFARIFRENAILSKGHMVEVGRADLVGRYVGWTADLVHKKFEEAEGGVLFIDEAYSLANDDNGAYGKEAIDTLVLEMENHRDDVIVIMAGYPNEMNEFISKNPGMASRVNYRVHFDDYSSTELGAIARQIATQNGMTLSDDACAKLKDHFENVEVTSSLGNGRYVRNIIEKAKLAQSSRLISKQPELLTPDTVKTITADDIIITPLPGTSPRRRIGFC